MAGSAAAVVAVGTGSASAADHVIWDGPLISTLYAAVADARAIVAFDTATMTKKARYPLGADVFPHSLAITSGRLWFGYQDKAGQGNFGSLDLSGDTAVVKLHDGDETLTEAPRLDTTPNAPGLLLVWDVSVREPTLGAVATYRVSPPTRS